MQAMQRRKRTFLEREEWLTIPWRKHSESKTPQHKILDFLCPLGGMLEDFYKIQDTGCTPEDLKIRSRPLWEKTKQLLICLFRWRWNWEVSHRDPVVYEVPVDPRTSWSVDDFLNPLFPTVLHYQSIDIADEITLYNTAIYLLMSGGHIFNLGPSQIAKETYESLPKAEEPPRTNPLTMPSGNIFLYLHTTNGTMRSVDYYLLEKHRIQGSYSLLWPLRMR